ncbi:MAG: hypothetical protein FWE16_02975 [Firmicutes bacterium]|nr:hypothetical protein [Bacillota bacterium]
MERELLIFITIMAGVTVGIWIAYLVYLLFFRKAPEQGNQIVYVDKPVPTPIVTPVAVTSTEPTQVKGVTRMDILADMRQVNDPTLEILDRFDCPRQPSSLKYKSKTFAFLYGTDLGIILIALLPEETSARLAKECPEFGKSTFPKGKDWYQLPIAESFTKEFINEILIASFNFAKAPKPPAIKKPTAKKPVIKKEPTEKKAPAQKPAAKKKPVKKPVASKPAPKK